MDSTKLLTNVVGVSSHDTPAFSSLPDVHSRGFQETCTVNLLPGVVPLVLLIFFQGLYHYCIADFYSRDLMFHLISLHMDSDYIALLGV